MSFFSNCLNETSLRTDSLDESSASSQRAEMAESGCVLNLVCNALRHALRSQKTINQHNSGALLNLMDGLLPEHVGLSECNEKGIDQTIRYLHIHDEEAFSIGIFVLPPKAQLPLHDHPGMSVLSRILYGGLTVRSFDFLGDPSEDAQRMAEETGCKWAVARNEAILTGPSTTALYPDWGNIHEFTAHDAHGCAIFDILTPPYNASLGRDCTYYCETDASALQCGTTGTSTPSLVLLSEVEPDDNFEVLSGVYAGPTVDIIDID